MLDSHARMYEDNERLDSCGNPSNLESVGIPIESVLLPLPESKIMPSSLKHYTFFRQRISNRLFYISGNLFKIIF